LQVSVDPATKLASIDFDDNSVDILDLDTGDLKLKGGVLCVVADWVKGLFIGKLKDQIKAQLAKPLNSLLCQKCNTKDDCSSLANQGCSMNKQCMRNNKCMQEIGIDGRIDLSALQKGASLDIFAAA